MSNLARIRKEAGLSQNELIKVSGVSKSAVLKYEIGERDINKASGATLFKLATALKCTVEELLENKEEIKEDVLFNIYCEWRKDGEKASNDADIPFTYCSGEGSAREDFTWYAKLDEEINYDDMSDLEARYARKHER